MTMLRVLIALLLAIQATSCTPLSNGPALQPRQSRCITWFGCFNFGGRLSSEQTLRIQIHAADNGTIHASDSYIAAMSLRNALGSYRVSVSAAPHFNVGAGTSIRVAFEANGRVFHSYHQPQVLDNLTSQLILTLDEEDWASLQREHGDRDFVTMVIKYRVEQEFRRRYRERGMSQDEQPGSALAETRPDGVGGE